MSFAKKSKKSLSSICVLLGLIFAVCACHVSPPQERAKPQIAPVAPPPAGPTEKPKEVNLNSLKTFLDKMEADLKLTESEKKSLRYSLEWLISVLTNEEVFKKFSELCSDASKHQNLEACVQEARKKLFDIHSFSAGKSSKFFWMD